MPTVLSGLLMIGIPPLVAKSVQGVAAIAVAIVVARCYRRDAGPLATAALIVGIFLATPHAFIYDLPMVTGAMALFIQARIDTTGSLFNLRVGGPRSGRTVPDIDATEELGNPSQHRAFGIAVRDDCARPRPTGQSPPVKPSLIRVTTRFVQNRTPTKF